ncbi:MAG: helix-turn-helix domain-containing protein [Gammaproteobacteria bacterium]|nr:helix-turn-helix domain-containing protein [Gammaproteobacteria bacterium]MBU0788192.1 helix-turn-helix domain-containing protein [Gammaproteobacteria bacterium]MBU0815311.1 helix-turn-helix domain-containing protein [Gammaproteobacteria bacterium]MBU1785581.1 helix-turn-helix domain-containing protein [Gammaproteobacteria bacterium]
MNLKELGQRIRNRREALGLSQDRLAKLSGLSRATVNQLETGAIGELGVTKLLALFDLLGLTLDAGTRPARKHALLMASRTASVSYKTSLDPGILAKALVDGALPTAITPHVATLLDEAPLSIIVSAIEEAATRHHVPPKQIWRHLIQWAHDLHSPRQVWV